MLITSEAMTEPKGGWQVEYSIPHAAQKWAAFVLEASIMDRYRTDIDFDTLAAKSFTAWRGIVGIQLRVETVNQSAHYLELRLTDAILGELGTLEINRETEGCEFYFSDVYQNYNEEFLKKNIKEINEITDNITERAKLLQERNLQTKEEHREQLEAKEVTWDTVKDVYLELVNPLSVPTESKEPEYLTILKKLNFEDKTKWDLDLISLWNNGKNRTEISKKVNVTPQRVTNRISELRGKLGKYGKIVLPYKK